MIRLIPQLARLDSSALIRWFEISGLLRQRPSTAGAERVPATAPAPRPAETGSLDETLAQLLPARTKSDRGQPEQASRAAADAAPLPLARDGVKLVEQSITQNLLQRASIGMQQESQQPLNLSLALPLLDEHQVIPLQIQLEQRSRAAGEAESSWDVRLNFDFDGLGPICCHLYLQGMTVAASFYSQLPSTRETIEQALPELKHQLSRAGFDFAELHSFAGTSVPTIGAPGAGFDEALIDIEV